MINKKNIQTHSQSNAVLFLYVSERKKNVLFCTHDNLHTFPVCAMTDVERSGCSYLCAPGRIQANGNR